MKGILHVLLFVFAAGCWSDSVAYEVQTHENLTGKAADRSVLQMDPDVLRNLGLTGGITDSRHTFPDSEGEVRTIRRLLEIGSRFEDNVSFSEIRVTKHFYNPLSGQGLDLPLLPTQIASPDWALASPGTVSGQEFSYWNARQHLFDALTKPAKSERERAFGLTFQSLGQVAHHLQDMAQPQHVRNDVHCHLLVPCGLIGAYAPSLFEAWTDLPNVRTMLPTDPAAIGYDVTSPAFSATFNSPRTLWHTLPPGPDSPALGKGLAEFTHRNFVSAGTNFSSHSGGFAPHRDFPLPTPTSTPATVERVDIATLLPGTSLRGELWFVSSQVQDNLTGQSVINPRASTFSIFDQDLQRHVPTFGRAFTLNRFNFEEAHKHLIPRAVAYSAGMINYFFRGKMDIQLPDEQVYAAADFSANEGFRQLKVKLRNTTPGPAGVEPMRGGKLLAILRFRRNTCFQWPSLEGVPGSASWSEGCRSPGEEERLKSDPVPVPEGIDSDYQLVTFRFSSPLPFNATDVDLQVVYRGPLGEEPDAVAAVFEYLSEPTFYNFDNFLDCGPWSCPTGSTLPSCQLNAQFRFPWWDGASRPAVAEVTGLKPGEHARVAFLTQAAYRQVYADGSTLEVARNQFYLDPVNVVYGPDGGTDRWEGASVTEFRRSRPLTDPAQPAMYGWTGFGYYGHLCGDPPVACDGFEWARSCPAIDPTPRPVQVLLQ
jgi:hypothetical protein